MNVNEMNMMTTEDMMMCGAYNNAVLPSPYFVKENHAGVVRTSCQDELFRERIIHLCGPVDMAQAYVIIDQLKCLEKENPLERIVMRISSETIRSQRTRIRKKIPQNFLSQGLGVVILGEENLSKR